jgi:hypothetical protein
MLIFICANFSEGELICQCGMPENYVNTKVQWITVPMFDSSVVSSAGGEFFKWIEFKN